MDSRSEARLALIPVRMLAGMLAARIGKRLVQRIWHLVDEADAPRPEQRDARWGKLVLALLLEGAVSRLARGTFDRASRVAVARWTGTWPGEDKGAKSG